MNSQTTAAKVQTLTAATIIPKNALGNSQVMTEVGVARSLHLSYPATYDSCDS